MLHLELPSFSISFALSFLISPEWNSHSLKSPRDAATPTPDRMRWSPSYTDCPLEVNPSRRIVSAGRGAPCQALSCIFCSLSSSSWGLAPCLCVLLSTHKSWASELVTFPLFLFWESCPSKNWLLVCFCSLVSLGSISLIDGCDQETSGQMSLWTIPILESHALLPHWDHSCLSNYAPVISLFYDNWIPALWNTLLPWG